MPFIIVGSVVTAIVLPFIPFFFNEGMKTGVSIAGMTAGLISMMCLVIVFMMSYRSPAVALMPDLTPKPLRSKANGVINVVGYVGGAIGSVLAMAFALTDHLKGDAADLWSLEIPFIITSAVLLVSLGLLLWNVRENKLHAELDKEISEADSLGESAEAVTNKETKLSKTNIRNLIIILVAEMLWFMSLNALETFQTNYAIFHLNTSSAGGIKMTLISGAASVVGFLVAGPIADKIGRKWTIFTGICVVATCYVVYSIVPAAIGKNDPITFAGDLPWIFYVILPLIGLGSSLIHMCSFPLVTDYCTSDKLGKFTSLYYTASMLAQSITPIVGGIIMNKTGAWQALPIYSTILMAAAGVVFFFVKAPHKNDKAKNVKGLAALGQD
ncbi:MAG: MFS transporter, partial [Bacteroidaceae bacterium]|nr:MFS transporter [Bacteroidaceae bacterium]